MAKSFLFVCYGNIMRSAFAEACFRDEAIRNPKLKSIRFASAGVRAQSGDRAETQARAMARKLGLSLDGHRATRTSRALVASFDRVYIMDRLNEELLLGDTPEVASKVEYLSVLTSSGPREIEDPYCQSEKHLEACFRRIQLAVRNLAESL